MIAEAGKTGNLRVIIDGILCRVFQISFGISKLCRGEFLDVAQLTYHYFSICNHMIVSIGQSHGAGVDSIFA